MAIIVLACFTDCECKKSILEGIKKQLGFGSEDYCTCAESDPSAHIVKTQSQIIPWTIHISKVTITEPLSWTSVKKQTITWLYPCLWQPITENTRQVLVPTANHNARRPCHIQLYIHVSPTAKHSGQDLFYLPITAHHSLISFSKPNTSNLSMHTWLTKSLVKLQRVHICPLETCQV